MSEILLDRFLKVFKDEILPLTFEGVNLGNKIFGAAIISKDDYSSENLKVQLKDIDAIAIRTANLSSDILEKCEKLKIVSRHGVGTDNVDVEYLNKNKIPLAITGTANAVSVAEHALMMILNLSKSLMYLQKFIIFRIMNCWVLCGSASMIFLFNQDSE